MEVIASIPQTREAVARRRRLGRSIGFVPTMGALHQGHASLIRAAGDHCDEVVVSIFVNPTQFGPGEDYERYPKSLETDLRLCEELGVDLVFTPSAADVYPDGFKTTVRIAGLTECLCGAHRPGHFDGVATVVAKLFNIVTPDKAYFGEKDYQQLKVIERMARDLDMPVEIVPCPTFRDDDGLAISSRNAYLSATERVSAASLFRALGQAAERVARGTVDSAALIAGIKREISKADPARIDYVVVVDPDSLEPLDEIRQRARICLAVAFGDSRLIDNLEVDASERRG